MNIGGVVAAVALVGVGVYFFTRPVKVEVKVEEPTIPPVIKEPEGNLPANADVLVQDLKALADRVALLEKLNAQPIPGEA
jgi:hypothetical protein